MQLNYRQQVAFTGLLVGAILGAIGAMVWLDYLSGKEIPETEATKLGLGDVARLATATVALVRQVNEMVQLKGESE